MQISLLFFMTDIRPNWCCGRSFWNHEDTMFGKENHSMRIMTSSFDRRQWTEIQEITDKKTSKNVMPNETFYYYTSVIEYQVKGY